MSRSSERNDQCCPGCGATSSWLWLQAPDRFFGKSEIYDLERCKVCSLVWLANPPSPNEMAQHYGYEYDEYVASVGETAIEARWQTPREVVMQYKSGGTLLDMGCSSGGFLATLRDRDWDLHGIEISEAVAARAKARSEAEVFVGGVLDAPYARNSFDVITCFHVLEHLYEPKCVLERVYQWLKPGGVFVTFLPNIDSAAARLFRSYWFALELPRHLTHFSPSSLLYLANATGFEVIELSTHRELFFEWSIKYINDDILRKVGFVRRPASQRRPASLTWRMIRTGFRLTVLPVLKQVVAVAGPGEIIHAVFRKPEDGIYGAET